MEEMTEVRRIVESLRGRRQGTNAVSNPAPAGGVIV